MSKGVIVSPANRGVQVVVTDEQNVQLLVDGNRNVSLEVIPQPRTEVRIDRGIAGAGVPANGTVGQFLIKQSATAYDTAWQDPDYVQFDTTAGASIGYGKLRWNDTYKSLSYGIIDGTDECLTGQQMYAYVTNADSVTITRGQPVYLYQATGNRASIKLAVNTSDATSAKTLGLAAQNIAPNQTGFVITQGVLDKVNTGAFTEGATLYLGATAGALTSTKPQAPNHLVYIGVVERANAGNGQIYVKPQNGYELDELHDVQIVAPLNGQTLVYDAATNLWKNQQVVGAFTAGAPSATGYLTIRGSDGQLYKILATPV